MPGSLAGKRIVLGVTGGIAAYKAVELCRLLVDAGAHVIPVMTRDAERFVGAITFSALASEPVRRSLWEGEDPIPHTHLGQSADVVVVAPATANFIAGYANGLADSLLAATVIATRAPVVVCPAMHTEMWEHPAVRENLAVLASRGVHIVEPESGRLAGGDMGEGRLAAPTRIAQEVGGILARRGSELDLKGHNVVVSAGGTREAIDPVRFITNRSSGKQGHALAEAAYARGARVALVTTTDRPVTKGIDVVRVESAADMEQALFEHCAVADAVIMAAAVADFRPKAALSQKISKSDGVPELVLEPTPDILFELAQRRRPGQVLVGFAAETHLVVEKAQSKLRAKGVDLMVANDVSAEGAGFDHDTNAVTIFEADGTSTEIGITSKRAVADAVLDRVAHCLRSRT